MGATFVLMLREGLEAALIVGILLAYLRAIGRKDGARQIWVGVVTAVGVSALTGAVLFFTSRSFEGRPEEMFEGIASLVAVGVLTWMVFWMRRHAINIKRELHDRIDKALESPRLMGLAAVAFVVVLREGIETALFLFSTFKNVGRGPGTLGAVLGLGLAIAIGIGIYRGGIRLNLGTFFRATGGFLLVIAAGLLAYGFHELIEAGVIPAGIDHIWNVSAIFSDKEGLGAFLKTMFGYNADPALTEFIAWLGYLLGVGFAFFKPLLRLRPAPVPVASEQ